MAAVVASIVIAVASCGANPSTGTRGTTTGAPPTTPALANPASTYCISLGGRVETVNNANGQQGFCVLPDGSRTDEWDLYRAAHPTPSTTSGVPRPTSSTAVPASCSGAARSAEITDEPGLSAAAAAMRADLARAAATCDWTVLAALVDRGGKAVRFSFGAETDAIAFWKQAEAGGVGVLPMRALRTLLSLPYATTTTPDGAVQYVWPAAFASEHPTTGQLQEIADTGLYSMATLQDWVRSGNNYLGYRVIVTADGDWTAYVTGD